jgi:hypothetical protein
MPLTVNAKATIRIESAEALAVGLGTGSIPMDRIWSFSLNPGTGADKIQYRWSRSGTTVISTPETFLLSALVDDLGRTMSFTKVRFWGLRNLSTNASAILKIGAAATNPWAAWVANVSDIVNVRPNNGFHLGYAPDVNGLAVVGGASDQLKIDPGAFAIPYELFFLGE